MTYKLLGAGTTVVDCVKHPMGLPPLGEITSDDLENGDDERRNGDPLAEIEGGTRAASSGVVGAVNKLLLLFQTGRDACVLVSPPQCLTLTEAKTEGAIFPVSDHWTISSSALKPVDMNQLPMAPSRPSSTGSNRVEPLSGSKDSPGCGSKCGISIDNTSLNTTSLSDADSVGREDCGTVIFSMVACFCEALYHNTDRLTVLVSFAEREANHWLDLLYQLPAPTSLPLRLRRYAVREMALLSQASFHHVSSLRDVVDLILKATKNRPQRKGLLASNPLVIHVAGIPSEEVLKGKEEASARSPAARFLVFAHPTLSDVLTEAWGNSLVLWPPPSNDVYRATFNPSAAGEQVQRILKSVGGAVPASIAVLPLPDEVRLIPSMTPSEMTVRGSGGHVASMQQVARLSLLRKKRGSDEMDEINRHAVPRREMRQEQGEKLVNRRKTGPCEMAGAGQCQQSSSNSSTVAVARRTLKQMQRDNIVHSRLPSLSPPQSTSYSRSRQTSLRCKDSFSLSFVSLLQFDSKYPHRLPSLRANSSVTDTDARTLDQCRKLSLDSHLALRPPALPVFYASKRLFCQREAVLAAELEERNIMELDEKQRRREIEAMMEDTEHTPDGGRHLACISQLIKRNRRKSTSIFRLSPFM
ncbi:hypothetical protein DQ04_00691100 [Trypanosoma grayi]|uniref:hypothetical protein n=1 Tax=Trypanosoma grayi TaxID=71804 RepID=UPI0004F47810|nr:hypothetical protein DQ04_00691100 [Trypanosoma grayi]KEG13964.1 hypothetical protein DQ04_00691100 [Trypanosoma grayi]